MDLKFNQILYFFSLILILGTAGCSDECKSTYSYYTYTPVYHVQKELLDSIGFTPKKELTNPGKIYYKDGYLYINEVEKGVHIIDNRDPSSPQNIGFINIPGNYDMAIRNNVLYADCYVDLLALDISTPTKPTILKRVENIFPNAHQGVNGYYFDQEKGVITTYNQVRVTEARDCDEASSGPVFLERGGIATMYTQKGSMAPGNSDGKAGSMARFALYSDYLYALNGSEMQLMDISKPAFPETGNKINVDWGIETIFPYGDKLFIGSQNGLFIYDNQNPEAPRKLSQINHVQSCDPVVVDDKYAYVTLRSGTECMGFTNQLEIIDIQNLSNPTLLKTYPMDNPHGLGKEGNTLFICDGASGLKIYDSKDILDITGNQLAHYKDIDSYDVIPLGGTLMMIGKDGLYQYDYSDTKNIKLLSTIPIVNNQ